MNAQPTENGVKQERRLGNIMDWGFKSVGVLSLIIVALMQLKFPTKYEIEKATDLYRAELREVGDKVEASTLKLTELITEMRVSQNIVTHSSEVLRDHETRIRVIETKLIGKQL